MPYYRFVINAHAPHQVVTERLRSVHNTPREVEAFPESSRRELSMPFVGYVKEDSFTLRRNIRYQNSFLPLIRGRILPTETGTQVKVTMFMHPLVAIFMVFWLWLTGPYAPADQSTSTHSAWPLFAFGLLVALGGFFLEAIKAKRLLVEAVLGPEASLTT